jgi:hypothetical protein
VSYTPSDARKIGRIELLPIRQAFPHEAIHFTTWMEENIERLSERVGIELTVVQREQAVGAFNVDLLCEDGEGNPVVVENQLQQTDHDHLGKLLTYLVNLDAASAIWVSSEPRPEHARVIDWLNESTPTGISFYLVKAEAVCVDGSAPAPLFTIQAAPSAQIKVTGHQKKEWAERHDRRLEFWTGLLAKSRPLTKLFSNIKPSTQQWITTGIGKSGVTLSYGIYRNQGSVDLYIDHDVESGAGNKAIFDALHQDRIAVEHECGATLDWNRLDAKRACRVRWVLEGAGLLQPEDWPELQDRMIKAMIVFDRAMRPRVAKIKG